MAKQSNKKGTLSLANTGDPDSGGSQFFINLGEFSGKADVFRLKNLKNLMTFD